MAEPRLQSSLLKIAILVAFVAMAAVLPVYAAPVKLLCRGTAIDASVGRLGTGNLIFLIDDANRSVTAAAADCQTCQVSVLQYDENELRFLLTATSGWHAEFTIDRLTGAFTEIIGKMYFNGTCTKAEQKF